MGAPQWLIDREVELIAKARDGLRRSTIDGMPCPDARSSRSVR
jgi:hypothetical protein